MIPRVLFLSLALAGCLLAHHEPEWSRIGTDQVTGGKSAIAGFAEWRELSIRALKVDKRLPRKMEVKRGFNREANESSSTVDCGVICDISERDLEDRRK